MRVSRFLYQQTISAHRYFLEHQTVTPDLKVWPRFFEVHEQQILLQTCLRELDAKESKKFRKQREKYWSSNGVPVDGIETVQEIFCPDEYYNFEEGHYDGVIRNYREMHLTKWPASYASSLEPLVAKLHVLCPSSDTQTHLLHLASDGDILPHIDNVDASGSWILGASLGAQRVLRLDSPDGKPEKRIEVSLPSGSVYLQKDSMRYKYRHSILPSRSGTVSKGKDGQRLSIMIRDLPKNRQGQAPPSEKS